MIHRVKSVEKLYDDSKKLYTEVVKGSADSMIANLNDAINNLKANWEGADAGVQINNIIDVHNGLIGLRNALSSLAFDSSIVASNYREIQMANKAKFGVLTPIPKEVDRQPLAPYVDNRDTINITPEVLTGKNLLDKVNDNFDDFKSKVVRSYESIMDNWQAGPNRDKATEAFTNFMNKSAKYKSILNTVSASINDALKNYSIQ